MTAAKRKDMPVCGATPASRWAAGEDEEKCKWTEGAIARLGAQEER
jgi:hypothetical protein